MGFRLVSGTTWGNDGRGVGSSLKLAGIKGSGCWMGSADMGSWAPLGVGNIIGTGWPMTRPSVGGGWCCCCIGQASMPGISKNQGAGMRAKGGG